MKQSYLYDFNCEGTGTYNDVKEHLVGVEIPASSMKQAEVIFDNYVRSLNSYRPFAQGSRLLNKTIELSKSLEPGFESFIEWKNKELLPVQDAGVPMVLLLDANSTTPYCGFMVRIDREDRGPIYEMRPHLSDKKTTDKRKYKQYTLQDLTFAICKTFQSY